MHTEKAITPKQQALRRMTSRVILCLLPMAYSAQLNAQCAMCRASLESEGDMAKGEAVNNGIVYLMAIPYLLVALVGYYVYRTRYAKKS